MAASPIEIATGLQKILVATDFSQTSVNAVRFALDLARAYHAKCYIFHSVSSLGYTLAGAEVLADEVASRDLHDLEAELKHTGDLHDVTHEMVVRQGDVCHEIEAVIHDEHIDLVVLGTRGRTGLRRLVLGSVAEQIFRAVACPVLTIGPEAHYQHAPKVRRILFPTDLSSSSRNDFAKAVTIANRNDAQLILLHSVMPFPVAEPGPSWYLATDVSERRRSARTEVLDKLKNLVATGAKLLHAPEYVVEFQYPAEAICEAADAYRADLILMGVRRASAFRAGHLPWATAHEVVCRAGCAVLTLRH
jgi:nucleotide-binding universal stress UspA family protein